jgi:hypothetical protein
MLFIVFFFTKTFGQEQYIRDFEKLTVIDTIRNQEKINSLKNNGSYVFESCFVSDWTTKDDEYLKALIKSEQAYWLVIAFPFEIGEENLHYSFEINGFTENGKYFLVSLRNSFLGHGAGGGNEIDQRQLVIMDMAKNSFIILDAYDYDLAWEYEERTERQLNHSTLDIANIIVDNDKITILNNCFKNSELKPCQDIGGVYEIQNQKLVKTKYYNSKKRQMKPVKYIGKLALGMTIEDLKLIYSDLRPVIVGNKYGTCADDDNVLGYDISDGEELLCYVTTKDERINSFLALSPSFNFGKITINSTAEEILQNYPKAKWRIDSLSEWEHLYIEELDVEIVFKTDDNNRVGKYLYDKKQSEMIFKKLNRKDAKPNFIQVK